MFAYTAWDSLQTVARQFDADLEIVSGDHIALAPHWARTSASRAVRRLAEQVRAGTGTSRRAEKRATQTNSGTARP